jgi:hypothetical protein
VLEGEPAMSTDEQIATLSKLELKGLSRPGSALIVLSGVLYSMIIAYVAVITKGSMEITVSGMETVPWLAAIAIPFAICFLGFVKYAASKGYSRWLGFWLCCAQLPGFIVLLLLPDRNSGQPIQS